MLVPRPLDRLRDWVGRGVMNLVITHDLEIRDVANGVSTDAVALHLPYGELGRTAVLCLRLSDAVENHPHDGSHCEETGKQQNEHPLLNVNCF